MARPTTDSLLHVETIAATANPQQVIAAAARQCYASGVHLPAYYSHSEHTAGNWVVETLLKGNKGHWSPLEHAYITLSLQYVPHDIMVQLRTHRHLSFSEQSLRYSCDQFLQFDVEKARADLDSWVYSQELDELVYIRRPGTYADRKGTYERTMDKFIADSKYALEAIEFYQAGVRDHGLAPEDARGLLPYNVRKHAYVSGNLRAWLHVADLRTKADSQPEFQQLMQQVIGNLLEWSPAITRWYMYTRSGKAILSP